MLSDTVLGIKIKDITDRCTRILVALLNAHVLQAGVLPWIINALRCLQIFATVHKCMHAQTEPPFLKEMVYLEHFKLR